MVTGLLVLGRLLSSFSSTCAAIEPSVSSIFAFARAESDELPYARVLSSSALKLPLGPVLYWYLPLNSLPGVASIIVPYVKRIPPILCLRVLEAIILMPSLA